MHQRSQSFAKRAVIMFSICLAAALMLEYWPSSNTLPWVTYEAALKEAAAQGKPILIDVYAEWCGPCKVMERTVFSDDSVRWLLTKRYVLAKVDGDEPAIGDSLMKRFHVNAYPTYIVLDPAGKERKRKIGSMEKDTFVRWISDSAGVYILQWVSLEEARQKARQLQRNILVVVLQSTEDIERYNAVFSYDEVRSIVDARYLPTLLVKSSPAEQDALKEIGASMNISINEALVISPEGRELGRFQFGLSELYSGEQLAKKLKQFEAEHDAGTANTLGITK
ncbi:MAG: thioredoxin family protein [bacterium]